jgi:urease accessory protein
LNAEEKSLKHGWLGELKLSFDVDKSRTYLSKKSHQGPLVIQKTLYPEGDDICHGVILHPPGGVAGGDRLVLEAELKENGKALLTTPGAGKWYKANNSVASQNILLKLKQSASIEWFPQENILFDGANVQLGTTVELTDTASFAGWDILCFGRQAKLEKWKGGHLSQHLKIYRDQKIIWHERVSLNPDSPLMNSKIGLDGNVIVGTFVVTTNKLTKENLEDCRNLVVKSNSKVGITYFNDIFCARYLGNSSEEAKIFFESLWMLLRPIYLNKVAIRPRIWNT